MKPYNIQRIKDAATELFKEKHFAAYESELQVTLCIITAFVDEYQRETGVKIDFKAEEPRHYESIDED